MSLDTIKKAVPAITRPHTRKVTSAPLGGSLAVIVTWILQLNNIVVSLEVAIAIASIITYLVGWAVPDKD